MRRSLSSLAAAAVLFGICAVPRAEAALTTESLLGFVKRVGARVDSRKGNILVTSVAAGRGRVEIRLVNETNNERLGFYAYGFGNVSGAKDREELFEYLLRANSSLAIGSFFVDDDQDIGYKFFQSTREPLNYTTFETAYLAMVNVIKDRGPVILKKTGYGTDAPPSDAPPADAPPADGTEQDPPTEQAPTAILDRERNE